MQISQQRRALDFKDVMLEPQYSHLTSRKEANTSTSIGHFHLKVPIISANMDTITGGRMAEAMARAGGMGILHRYTEPKHIIEALKMLRSQKLPAVPSIGVQTEDMEKAHLYAEYTDAICIDIAHGDSKLAYEMLRYLRTNLRFQTVIAGNVATREGACRLVDAGANVIKIGIGPGSVCTTRAVTGHGVPQLQAIMDITGDIDWANAKHVRFIADGGIKTSGDIVKALAAGAHAVMVGSLFAGTDEAFRPDVYRGMASEAAQRDFRGSIGNDTPEGTEVLATPKGPVGHIVERLAGGIRSGMSYTGVTTLQALREEAIFRLV